MRTSTRLLLPLVLALLVPIIPFAVVGELPGERWLSATDHNDLLFGATGAGLLTSDVLLPIPSSIVGTLLGARLGFLPGWAWGWAGMVLGNLIGYAIGHLWPARLAADLPQTPTLLVLFASRPVPVLSEAVALTAGAGRMRVGPFLAASVAGNGLYSLALAGNGAALLPGALVGPGLVLPMLLPVAAWLSWQWLARQNSTPKPRGKPMLYLIINRTRPDLDPDSMTKLGKIAQDFYDNVPAGLTLRGDWAAQDGSRTFSLLETDDPALLEQVQAPFRPYVEMEVVPVRPITGWGKR